MEFKDYYQTLGVTKAATADEIKKAFRKLARKHHPDISKAADATERMAELNEAVAVLSDPARRAAYDALASGTHGRDDGGFQAPPNWDAGFDFQDDPAGPGDRSDFFEQLFRRAAHAHKRHGPADASADAQASLRGADHHARIELDLSDAYQGAERTVSLRSSRLDAAGRVAGEERSLQIKIPKGVHEGQHIRLGGRGSPGIGTAAAGDLLLEVVFKPDPRWRAEGRDVHQRVLLSPWEAMLGATATIRTPGGDAEVRIPAGWKAGRKLRLKGRGIPGQTPGDLYLELELTLPPADSDATRAAYAAMSDAFPTFQPRAVQGD
jgi:curved DNA-binding protein